MKIRALSSDLNEDALEEVARLRITVFRDWPYLLDGDLEYERKLLHTYRKSEQAVIAGAYDGDWLVGAAAGAPLLDHIANFSGAFQDVDFDISKVFYFAESVLLPAYRGRGAGKAFFDLREEHAKSQGFSKICFCSVLRPNDHPLRPENYQPQDGFWQQRGYEPMAGVVASFAWKDVNQMRETQKPLQFWIRDL